jgi:predicted transcriptional regulator of viral defense system
MRTTRPAALRGAYACPEKELSRLHGEGRLLRLARGTYLLPPDSAPPGWEPDLELAAIAYATAAYPGQTVCLYGVSAARWLHAIPRAINIAIIATPHQHRPVTLNRGQVIFTRRDTSKLDTMPVNTPLGPMRITTPEQTLINLIANPTLGDRTELTQEATQGLLPQTNPDWLDHLTQTQPATIRVAIQRLVKDHA